jgi:hypothetical protein
MLFERVSGMRINFYKSECVPMNLDEDRAHDIAHILSCPVGTLPIKYLRVHLHFDKLKREDMQSLLDKLKDGRVEG